MNIRLSPKHGVNPSINVCFYCGEDKNELILPGMMKGDAEAPHRAVWNKEPCDKCKGYMEQGVILIEVDESKTTNMNNPWRTGRLSVVTENFIRRIFQPPELVEDVCKRRMAFIPVDTYELLGLHDPPEGTPTC